MEGLWVPEEWIGKLCCRGSKGLPSQITLNDVNYSHAHIFTYNHKHAERRTSTEYKQGWGLIMGRTF